MKLVVLPIFVFLFAVTTSGLSQENSQAVLETRGIFQEQGPIPPEQEFYEALCGADPNTIEVDVTVLIRYIQSDSGVVLIEEDGSINLEGAELEVVIQIAEDTCRYYRDTDGQGICAIDPFGSEALGTGEGFLLASTMDINPTQYRTMRNSINSSLVAPHNVEDAVALVILDYFEFGDFDIDFKMENFTDFIRDGESLTHGDSVLYHTLSLLSSFGSSFARTDDGFVFPNLGVVVIPQEIGNGTLGEISSRIDAIRDGSAFNDEYREIVVNMSFGLVPCGLIREFLEGLTLGEYTLATSGNLLGSITDDETVVATVSRRLMEIFFGIANNASGSLPTSSGDVSITYIAAAGNFGLLYPMFPGAWEYVTSVSATNDYDDSNAGEIASLGGSIGFIQNLFGDVEDLSEYASLGTSYAAPVVSVFAALDMSSENQLCTYISRELDHWDVVANVSQHQINFRLPNAVQNICQQTP
ncbi:MAG: hypothetical protein AAF708_04435 [Deinococcota bacterium]